MHNHILVQTPAEFDDARERVEPSLIGQNFLRKHTKSLRRVANAPDIWHSEQPLADQSQMIRLEVVTVASADDHVLKFRPRSNVCERLFPAREIRHQLYFLHALRIQSHRVAARAETAIDGTRILRQKKRLVRVAMRKAGHW